MNTTTTVTSALSGYVSRMRINKKSLFIEGTQESVCKYGWINPAHQFVPWQFLLGKNESIVGWEIQGDKLILFKEEELTEWQQQDRETERLLAGYEYMGDCYEPDQVVIPIGEIFETLGLSRSDRFYTEYSQDFLAKNLKTENYFKLIAEFRHQFTRYDRELVWTGTQEEAFAMKVEYNQQIIDAYPFLDPNRPVIHSK